jgi:hypothetical protein
MSDSSLFYGGVNFRGDWIDTETYNTNDVVESSNGSAYKCGTNGISGVGYDPSTDGVNWDILVPGAEPVELTVNTVTNVSGVTTFGVSAGSTFEWVGVEWVLSNVGNTITLTKIKSNCNCNCNCNCSGINCNCTTNCNCISYPFCGGGLCYCNCSNCSTTAYGYPNLCTCVTNCNCYGNCNCYHNCNCNCSAI